MPMLDMNRYVRLPEGMSEHFEHQKKLVKPVIFHQTDPWPGGFGRSFQGSEAGRVHMSEFYLSLLTSKKFLSCC